MGRSLQDEQVVNAVPTPPSEAKGGTTRLRFKSSVEPSSERARRARNFTANGNRISKYVKISYVLTIRLPFAVKFLEFLEIGLPAIQFSLHPKEAP